MDDELPDVIQQKLQAVRERFAAQLAGRLAEVRQLAEIFAEDPQRDILMDVQKRLHSLAGACGMFGFAELGRQARAVEIEAGERLVDPAALSGAAVEDFVGRVMAFADNDLSLGDKVLEDAMRRLVGPGRVRSVDQPVRIHLIETDPLVAAELSSALEQFGYVLRRFSSLADAEAAAQSLAPDVLVMDLSLALAAPAASGAKGRTPLIFVSAQGDFAARMRAATSGGDAFLIKPVDVPRLAECIEELVPTQPEPAARVLVVDDEVLLTQHCRLVLEGAGMAVQTLNSAPALLEVLAEFRPEVILLDLNMPDYSGQELAKMVRQQPEWVGIAISYLSAESNLDRQIEALAEDGDDFLTKPISDRHLVASVAARARRSRQLARLAAKDSLTGLLKHSAIKEQLVHECARQARSQARPLSVAMVDLDHFKRVNDTWGHAAGDRVIKVLSQLLRQRLRTTDSIGRYGGEEFLVVMPDCGQAHAKALLDDIRQRFSAIQFPLPDGHFCCQFSAGLATSDRACEPSALLGGADAALYQAKRSGRDRIIADTSLSLDNGSCQ